MNLKTGSTLFHRSKSAVLASILGASLLVSPVAYAQDATPPVGTPQASPEAVVVQETEITNLMSAQIDQLPEAPFTVRVLRITLQPGAITPMHSHHGPEMDMVETGEVTIRSLGDAPVTRADGTEEMSTGEEVTLNPGDMVHFPAEVGQFFENSGDEPATMLSSVIIPVGPDYVNERITWIDGEPSLEGVSYQKLGDGLVQEMPQQSAEWVINSVVLPAGEEMPALQGVSMITPVEGNLSFSIDAGQVQITRADSNMLQPNSVLGTTVSLGNADAAFFPNGVTATARDAETNPLSLLMMDVVLADGAPNEPAVLTFNEGDGTVAGVPAEPEGPILVTTNSGSVNLRSEPSVNGDIVDQLDEGIELEVLDGPVDADDYVWYQVRVTAEGGSEGWMVADFLDGLDAISDAPTTEDDVDAGEATADSDLEFPVDSSVVTTEESVRLRPEPSTEVEAIEALPLGDVLTVTGEPVDDGEYIWLPVETSVGLTGYVVIDFVEAAPADSE